MKAHPMDIPLFKNWLIDKKQLAESTIHTYTHSVNKFLVKGPDIDSLEDYNNFLIEMSHKKRCPHFYSALKAYVEYKLESGNVKDRIIDGLIKPPDRKDLVRERKHLEEDVIIQVINYLDKEKHRVIALIQNLTGVRAGDILRLKHGSISPEEYKGEQVLKITMIGKGKKRNVVYIHDPIAIHFIIEYITTQKAHKDYYFLKISKFKGRDANFNDHNRLMIMNYNWFWADLKQALNTAGIDRADFATHDFRRCFARRFWEKHQDIHQLQQVLNHADPKVTLRYLEQSGMHNIDLFKEMQS